MRLYICEKPEVAKHLAAVIEPSNTPKYGYIDCGSGQIVTWCVGHLLALKDPEDFDANLKKWRLEDLPMRWQVGYKPNVKTQDQLNIVLKLLRSANQVFSATDIDAAGQAIADELFEYAGYPLDRVSRILINDNNPKKIAKALQPDRVRPNREFRGLYLEEKSRAIADQKLGYNLTRLLTCQAGTQGFRRTLNVGRVQSAIVGLVVRRIRSIEEHKKHTYYLVRAEMDTTGGLVDAQYVLPEENMLTLDDNGRMTNAIQVESLVNSLSDSKAELVDLETKRISDSAPLPYDLLSLQRECSRLYGMKPSHVLEYTQKLREAPYYSITYNRSDCRYCPDESFDEAPEVLTALGELDLFKPLVDRTSMSKKSRCFNSKKTGAHGAIIPTGSTTGFESMPDELLAVYILIARHYIIQFMDKRERIVTTMQFGVKNKENVSHYFKSRVQRVEVAGWSSVFQNDAESTDVELNDVGVFDETQVAIGGQYNCKVRHTELETKPLTPYSMTTLLSDLKSTAKYVVDEKLKDWLLEKDRDNEGEYGGIGTAATRSAILENLFKNGFLEERNSGRTVRIYPTDEGNLLYDLLPESITSPNTTAIWSHCFKLVSKGEMTIDQFMSEIDSFIAAECERVKREGLKIPQHLMTKTEVMEERCPKCGTGNARRFNGRKGRGPGWRCGDCKTFFDDVNGQIFYKKCPDCNSQLRIIKGKGRKQGFVGCSSYPKCNHKAPISL